MGRLAPLAAGLLALLVYLATLPRGLTWDLGGADGGELAAAVYTLGLAHPPGYPTYLLAGQLAHFIPLESFAWRLNVFSALSMAGAVTLTGYAAAHLIAGEERPTSAAYLAGGLAGLAFGLVEVVWSQAIITEVYALAALFLSALLWLALEGRRPLLFGTLAGLGLGSHYLVGLPVLFAALYRFLRRNPRAAGRDILLAALGLLMGLSVFVYLPLRAGAVPLSNWGNPDTLPRFWRVVSAAEYAGRYSPGLAAARLAPLVGVLVRQLALPGLALAVVGLSVWWETRRPLCIAALTTLVVNLVLVAGYDSADTLPYLVPTLLLAALALGTAAHALIFEWLPARYRLAGAALALVVLAPLAARGLQTTARATTAADAFGREVVAGAPAGALILSEDDAQTFAIRYAALVSVGRQDIIPVDPRLLDRAWYRADLARAYPELGLDPAAPLDAAALLRQLPADVPIVRVPPPAD